RGIPDWCLKLEVGCGSFRHRCIPLTKEYADLPPLLHICNRTRITPTVIHSLHVMRRIRRMVGRALDRAYCTSAIIPSTNADGSASDGSGVGVIATKSLLGEGSTKSPSLKMVRIAGPTSRRNVQPDRASSTHPTELPGRNPKPLSRGGGSERKRI